MMTFTAQYNNVVLYGIVLNCRPDIYFFCGVNIGQAFMVLKMVKIGEVNERDTW